MKFLWKKAGERRQFQFVFYEFGSGRRSIKVSVLGRSWRIFAYLGSGLSNCDVVPYQHQSNRTTISKIDCRHSGLLTRRPTEWQTD